MRPTSSNFTGFWFHFIVTSYGAWLPGDSRGFRTRHHRQHIEGDYKNPPKPGTHAAQLQRSRLLLKQPAVHISEIWRPIVGEAILTKLIEQRAFVLCLAVAAQHMHVLAKLRRGQRPRMAMGMAKKHATFEVKRLGWTGKLWACRGKEIPIGNRRHQLNAYRYILAHADQGAWIWDWKNATGG